jgi:hypothetical protein
VNASWFAREPTDSRRVAAVTAGSATPVGTGGSAEERAAGRRGSDVGQERTTVRPQALSRVREERSSVGGGSGDSLLVNRRVVVVLATQGETISSRRLKTLR